MRGPVRLRLGGRELPLTPFFIKLLQTSVDSLAGTLNFEAALRNSSSCAPSTQSSFPHSYIPHPLSLRIVSSFLPTSPAKSHWSTMSYPSSSIIPLFPRFFTHPPHPQRSTAILVQRPPQILFRLDMQVTHSYPLLPPNWNPAFQL